ncbi:MAG: hypothetical protein LBC27_00335 [Spirochaetaceae bacterium]|jgi:hypothetical protein|nr:hypothetical protein [Spirochaetaceae bacterium]
MTHLEKTYFDTVPVYGFLLFLLLGAVLFMTRPAVVVVTDDVFSAVYGIRREHLKRIEMSVRLFRRVRLVRISENAEIDAVVFAVQDAGRKLAAAVFPYRYYDAALRYAAQNPRTPAVVMSGQNITPAGAPPAEGGGALLFIKEDEAADFYRAGLCAAFFSARQAETFSLAAKADGEKSILIISNEIVAVRMRDFFEQGLRSGGSKATCVFKGLNDNYPINELSCITLWGPANTFLYSGTENRVPVIIFSWIDPEFTSPNVKIIVDDSPLQLLPAILKALGEGGVKRNLREGNNVEVFIPSTFKVMTLRANNSLPLVLRLNIIAKLPVSGAAYMSNKQN